MRGGQVGKVGDRSVVVGPTDDRGNTILNKGPLAVGHGAYACPIDFPLSTISQA
jgi:hypothetical protein